MAAPGLEEALRSSVLCFSVFLLFPLSSAPASAQGENVPAGGTPLTVERIYAHGPLIGNLPEGISWSPDSKHLTYLDGGELVDLDPDTGKPHILVSRAKLSSLGGAAGSEEDKDHRQRYGMASYLWAPDSKHLLFDANGRLWLYDLGTGTGVQVGFTDTASGDDPKFSPNGDTVAFIRNHGLSIVRPHEMVESAPYPVAPAPQNSNTSNGQVDWVYEEELDVRSNYFWSPDSKNIAFLQMNEERVPQYPIEDWLPTHAQVELQRYPQPGDPNPDVRVGVVGLAGGHVNWVRLPAHAGQDYAPRFGWIDRHILWIETLARNHQQRDIYFSDLSTGQTRLFLEITDEKFVDENYDVFVDGGNLVLSQWKDGHNHIYLYSYNAANPMQETSAAPKQLTHGDFDVDGISVLDSAHKLVYYASNEGNPLEQQIWQVNFDGERKAITAEPGFHEGNFAPDGHLYVDKFSTRMDPTRLSVCKTDGAGCKVFWSTRALEPFKLVPPAQLEFKADDGSTLYATLLLPPGKTSPGSVPLILNPYGGPGPQTVQNHWEDALLFDELLAQHGFAVLHTDNRGTGHRGRDFAQAAYHTFGPVQFDDQLTVLEAVLAKNPQLDAEHLGWWGWSWGGTFTLYAMTHSDRFKAGVSVAPVTDWRDYDSIYTERYLGQPADAPDLYKDFSVINSAAKLKGHLLLVHGTGDDNVHLENSVQFIQKLIEADLPYDLQIYPRKTHSISGPDVRTHLFQRILTHFELYLKPAGPEK
ncbi:alpha/beta fold hydrolase [Acidobacteria bacterium AB60]|nr:alpha/beta fold hydrolase [Acidobacteria bacterium AB60]